MHAHLRARLPLVTGALLEILSSDRLSVHHSGSKSWRFSREATQVGGNRNGAHHRDGGRHQDIMLKRCGLRRTWERL